MKIIENFVLYRVPGENIFRLWFLDEKNETKTYFIFHSFDNKVTRRLYKKEEIILTPDELTQLKFELNLDTIDISKIEQNHKDYIKKCNLFIDALKEKELDKVIFSRIKFATIQDDYPQKLIKLAEKYPSAMVYLANFDRETWMGASPEKLVQIHGNNLSTVALASTKAVSDNRKWTSKEIKEHQLVVDYIAEELKDYHPKQEETKTITLGEIQHLITEFSAQLNVTTQVEQICNSLHPTPAVCGMPKKKAHSFILENEGYDRQFYTGYFGVISDERSEIYVNLRCAQIYANKIAIYVGGGLLAESNPEKEWQETEWKAKALL